VRRRAAALLGATVLAGAFTGALARAEIVQRGDLRVVIDGSLTPRALPRSGAAPVSVSVGGRVATTDGSNPPQLRTISIAINRKGRFDSTGLPVCEIRQIQPSTNAEVLRACRRSLIGTGSFSANVVLPQQSPFPSQGKVLAFNGEEGGRPVILAHVFGTEPIPPPTPCPSASSPATAPSAPSSPPRCPIPPANGASSPASS
jgi:hypothetical protein